MKRLIIIILIGLLVPISYVSAEDKKTLDLVKDNTLMLLNGYQPKLAKYNYILFKEKEMSDFLDSMEEQRRIIDYDRISAEGGMTSFLNDYNKEKVATPNFNWAIIPNLEESQPSVIIQFICPF